MIQMTTCVSISLMMLEFSKKEDAGCDVYHKGVKVRHYDKVMVSDIPEIQNWAATLR